MSEHSKKNHTSTEKKERKNRTKKKEIESKKCHNRMRNHEFIASHLSHASQDSSTSCKAPADHVIKWRPVGQL